MVVVALSPIALPPQHTRPPPTHLNGNVEHRSRVGSVGLDTSSSSTTGNVLCAIAHVARGRGGGGPHRWAPGRWAIGRLWQTWRVAIAVWNCFWGWVVALQDAVGGACGWVEGLLGVDGQHTVMMVSHIWCHVACVVHDGVCIRVTYEIIDKAPISSIETPPPSVMCRKPTTLPWEEPSSLAPSTPVMDDGYVLQRKAQLDSVRMKSTTIANHHHQARFAKIRTVASKSKTHDIACLVHERGAARDRMLVDL